MTAIIKEYQTYDYAIEIALDWWIKNTSEVSWKELISSVDRCGEKDTADAMKKKITEEGNYKHSMATSSYTFIIIYGVKTVHIKIKSLFCQPSSHFHTGRDQRLSILM